MHSENYPLLARDFENSLGAFSSILFDDEDLIPILDRADDSDLSRPDSSRCSSLSNRSSEWVYPLKDSFPPCSHFFGNATCQLPRAPPPTPLPTSPNFMPRCQNETHLEVPLFTLSADLTELRPCPAMESPVFMGKPSWDLKVEENLSCSVGQIFKNTSKSRTPCTFCDLAGFGFHSQTAINGQKIPSQSDALDEKHESPKPQLYQFPSLNSYSHPNYLPSTPPPSICSEGSLDDDQDEITWHSFLRQPYSMVEIDYQLQLLFLQQQTVHTEQVEPPVVGLIIEVAVNEQPKQRIRLRNKSLSSVEKAGGALGKIISRAVKKSLSR